MIFFSGEGKDCVSLVTLLSTTSQDAITVPDGGLASYMDTYVILSGITLV